jgi:uncharacterized damage-inducible protein DinB
VHKQEKAMKNLITLFAIVALGTCAVAQGTKPSEQKEKPAVSEAKSKAETQQSAPKPQAQPAPTSPAQVYHNQLRNLEREMVDAAEAMPAEKFDFKPDTKMGEFAESRTFKQQIGHVAVNNFLFASWLTGEKFEATEKDRENGPASLTDKTATVKYLKDSFAAAHKALDTINKDNLLEGVSTGGERKMPRMAIGNIFLWHGFDHYGQMAIYLRMNGIVPPASRPRQ